MSKTTAADFQTHYSLHTDKMRRSTPALILNRFRSAEIFAAVQHIQLPFGRSAAHMEDGKRVLAQSVEKPAVACSPGSWFGFHAKANQLFHGRWIGTSLIWENKPLQVVV